MGIRYGAPIYVGAVTVPTPAPLPGPIPTEIGPSSATLTPAGGVRFTLTDAAISPIYPIFVRAVWLPPDFVETPDPMTVLDAGAPGVELPVPGSGEFTIEPDASVPPGDYKLCLVPGYTTPDTP